MTGVRRWLRAFRGGRTPAEGSGRPDHEGTPKAVERAAGETTLERQIKALETQLRRGPPWAERDVRTLYDLIGQSLGEQFGPSPEHNPCSVLAVSNTVLRMADGLRPGLTLNVGIGGYPLVDLELARRGFRMVGLDYSTSLTALAHEASRRSGVPLRCVVGNGITLPFEAETFEVCLCSETLEHVVDDGAVVREIARVLKPAGTLLLTVPCRLALHGLGQRIRQYLREGRWILHPTHLREYTCWSTTRLIRDRFTIERWYPVPFTTASFAAMPIEWLLSAAVTLPGLRHGAPSIAFRLTKRDRGGQGR